MSFFPLFAFSALGSGLLVAGLMWAIPRLRRRRQVRRFRNQLHQIDTISIAWRRSLVEREPSDEIPGPMPEPRRGWRHRRGHPDGGDALV